MVSRGLLLLVISWFIVRAVQAQVPVLVPYQRIAMTTPAAISVNQYSNLLIGDSQGTITAYDSLGSVITRYAPERVASVTLLEAWQTLRVFAFHREMQTYTLLDRFLTPVTEQTALGQEQAGIGFARLATLASDNQLWIFDDTDFSLKKYNLTTREITLQVPLNLVLEAGTYQLEFMREYQNLLFIADYSSGILVFDNLGNFKKKIMAKKTAFFGFAGDELYLTEDNHIRFISLYSMQERRFLLPAGIAVSEAVVLGRSIVLFTPQEMIFCSLPLKGR